ncbi:T9SS type A sorting domain-containing protein [Viscerimonas tarda]
MKTTLTIFLSLCFIPLFSQISLRNNAVRAGDKIVKQQVEYKDPGRSGVNVIWDFSKLESINPEYKLSYSTPRVRKDSLYILGADTFKLKNVEENELIVGREHRTNYYYRVKNNVMYCLGHENPTTLMHYIDPIPVIGYPMSYGREITLNYHSDCLYSSQIQMLTHGNVRVESDALGKMVLPSKDTLEHVIRIKTVRTILSDSIEAMDSIRIKTQIETYQWYSKGYRYPVFETVKAIHQQDTIEDVFTTAFFFPPQEHYYLENDPDNIAVLDSLDNAGGGIYDQNNPDGGGSMQQTTNFAYNFYPNPVATDLHIEYLLEQNATVNISLYNMSGQLQKSLPEKIRQAGLYYETIDCGNLITGTYVLRLKIGNEIVNEIIVRR